MFFQKKLMYLLYAGRILTKVDLRGYNSWNEKKNLSGVISTSSFVWYYGVVIMGADWDLTQLDLTWFDLTWLDLTQLDSTCLNLTQLDYTLTPPLA